MNFFTVALFFALAVAVSAGHWGHEDGQWDEARWGDHSAHGHGHWDGQWDDGHWDDGHWDGQWAGHGHSDVVVGHGATIVGPSAYGHGHGYAGAHWGGHGHGVVVKGPATAPATIVGPSGKVHADGLWGVTHGHGHYAHHW